MSDEKRRTRPAVQYGPTAGTVASNVQSLRKRRQLSIYQLSALLRSAGRAITPAAVGKIERQERQVSVDDLMALAVALGVSPVTLLLPPNARGPKDQNGIPTEARTEVTGAGEVGVVSAWRWAWCEDPLHIDPDLSDEEADRLVMDFLLNSRPIGLLSATEDDRIMSAAAGTRRRGRRGPSVD
ncbi:helix-turn-helix domain-containing protein [Streptomyces marokkonensis]|uniref:helix-turn-helix domain-containing protein n=1 Tax=Streptomyces marokkonensis TaxID=324855 RepID=UPI001AD6DBF7|nr:helix-turn-helix transcriptional regulator [Streptomyces marokkonensis]